MTVSDVQAGRGPRYRQVVGKSDGCWWITFTSSKLPELPLTGPELGPVEGADLSPPRGTTEGNRVWVGDVRGNEGHFGCASHRGPPTVDKGNQDFAFALARSDCAGASWVLAGVCDGVTQSPWSERGARHAAAAFIEIVTEALGRSVEFANEILEPEGKRDFAMRYQRRLLERLNADGQRLQTRRVPDPEFGEPLYRKAFLDAPGAEKREAWFQTTILATALGPRGGFALLMGDGCLRLERTQADGPVQRKEVPLQSDPSKPERFVGTQLSVVDVLSGIRGILPEGASELRVVLSTDGVSKTPEHGLEAANLEDTAACEAFLHGIATRGDVKRVESDNMSVAFASRRVSS